MAEKYGSQHQSEVASTRLVEFYVSEKTMLEEFLYSQKLFTPGCRGVDSSQPPKKTRSFSGNELFTFIVYFRTIEKLVILLEQNNGMGFYFCQMQSLYSKVSRL